MSCGPGRDRVVLDRFDRILDAQSRQSERQLRARDPLGGVAGEARRLPRGRRRHRRLHRGAGAQITAGLVDALPGTVAVLGDAAYPSGTPDQFARCYEPTWGRAGARLVPAPGGLIAACELVRRAVRVGGVAEHRHGAGESVHQAGRDLCSRSRDAIGDVAGGHEEGVWLRRPRPGAGHALAAAVRIGGTGIQDPVEPVEHDSVAAWTARHTVSPGAPDQQVTPGAAQQRVAAAPAQEAVAPRPARQPVAPAPAQEAVVASQAEQAVGARRAPQHFRPGIPPERRSIGTGCERPAACGAERCGAQKPCGGAAC